MTKRSCALALALLLPSCGGGGGTSSTPVTTPPTTLAACNQVVVFQGSAPVPASTLVEQDFTFNAAARLDVVLDWTVPSSPMGVYVVQGACTLDQFNARTCNFVIRSEPSTIKPRKVSASAATGAFSLLVANYGATDESAAVQVISSSATCAPLATVPAVSGTSAPALERLIRR
jgi:hypothetical protein